MAYGNTVLSEDQAQEAQRLPPRPGPQVGTSGNALTYGRVSDRHEHNLKLQNGEFFRDFRKMLRSPAAHIAAVKRLATMQSATFTVVSPPGASEEPADLLREQFGLDEHAGAGRLRTTLRAWVGEAALFTLAGAALFETTWRAEDGRDWIDALLPRDIDSVDAWVVDERENFCGIWQRPQTIGAGSGERRFIPASQLVHLVQFGSPGNPEGIGDFRSVHSQWADQQKTYNLAGIGAQRYAVATPKVTINVEMARALNAISGDETAWYNAQRAAAKLWTERYVAGESAGMVPPPFWVVELFGERAFNPEPLFRQIEHYERVQLMAGDAQFMQLGSAGSGGSYSLGETQVEGGIVAAEAGLRVVFDTLNGPARPGGGVVGALMYYNFGESLKAREYPRLEFSGIRAPAWLDHLDKLPALSAGGWLLPDDASDESIRDGLELSPTSERRSTSDRMRISPLATVAGQAARGASTSRAPEDGPLVARRQP